MLTNSVGRACCCQFWVHELRSKRWRRVCWVWRWPLSGRVRCPSDCKVGSHAFPSLLWPLRFWFPRSCSRTLSVGGMTDHAHTTSGTGRSTCRSSVCCLWRGSVGTRPCHQTEGNYQIGSSNSVGSGTSNCQSRHLCGIAYSCPRYSLTGSTHPSPSAWTQCDGSASWSGLLACQATGKLAESGARTPWSPIASPPPKSLSCKRTP